MERRKTSASNSNETCNKLAWDTTLTFYYLDALFLLLFISLQLLQCMKRAHCVSGYDGFSNVCQPRYCVLLILNETQQTKQVWLQRSAWNITTLHDGPSSPERRLNRASSLSQLMFMTVVRLRPHLGVIGNQPIKSFHHLDVLHMPKQRFLICALNFILIFFFFFTNHVLNIAHLQYRAYRK